MKRPLTVLLLLMFGTPLAATDLTGRWSLDLLPDFSGNMDNIGCSFVQEGQKLTANCGAGPNILGDVKGTTVTLRMKTGRQNELTATFVGELNQAETTISGTWQLQESTGTREGRFTATKISAQKDISVLAWTEWRRHYVLRYT